jgi:hypothetical protein
VVNATVVIAEIAGYPALWQLHNETLGLHLAKPIDDKHLVYYNIYENTVFCDWKRLVEGVELLTPTQLEENTTRDSTNDQVVLNNFNAIVKCEGNQ